MGALLPRPKDPEITIQLEEVNIETPSAPTGLRNIGNTCYINATLQCLLQTQALSAVLSPALAGHGSLSQQRLIESYRLLASQQSTAKLRKLKQALNSKHRRYAGYKQMDSSEFFLDLMSAVMEISPELKQKIGELFTVEVTDVKKCALCGLEKTCKYEQLALTLPLAPAQVSFTAFSGTQTLLVTGKENWMATDIRKFIQEKTEIPEILLVLVSSESVLRIVSDSDSLHSLNLLTNSLHYFPKDENEIIIEIRAYKPGLFIRHSKGYLVLKRKKPLNAEDLVRDLKALVKERFRDSGENIVVPGEVAKVTCTAAYFQDLQHSQAFLSAFSDNILRLELVSDHLQSPVRPPSSSLQRDCSCLSLSSCFSYISAEQAPDPSNQMPCEPCKGATSFSELSQLSHTSQYLVICLQRYAAVSLEKDTREVEICQRLDIGPGYDLYAVIKHRGSKSRGHYTSVVRRRERWYHCNDRKVEELEAGEVSLALQEDAYILFYQQSGL